MLDNTLNIKITSTDGSEVFFKIKKTTRLNKLKVSCVSHFRNPPTCGRHHLLCCLMTSVFAILADAALYTGIVLLFGVEAVGRIAREPSQKHEERKGN